MEEQRVRIAIDIAPVRPPLTGVGNYELYLIDALLRREDAPDMIGFGNFCWTEVNLEFLQRRVSAESDVVELHDKRLWTARNFARRLGAQRIYSILRGAVFEASVKCRDFTLFHAFGYVPPGSVNRPVIPVVYDLSFIRFPETHPPERIRSLERLARYIELAPVVHTISNFSAQEIADVFRIDRSRIVVIYPGVKPCFCITTENGSKSLLAQYGLAEGEYFLVVSTREPRKNLRTLVSAFSRVPNSLRSRMPLCVVGGGGWGNLALPAEWRSLQQEGSLRFLGYVPDIQLQQLYSASRAMFYPSIYEGFGMPIIEALACGAQVVCSDAASMPEAIGSVGRCIPPLDVAAWTDEFMRVVDEVDVSAAEQTRERLAHAAQFTWSRAAEKTLEIYRSVAKT
jgi:glycosyltransferase involved in cell wall biosynthesis